MSQCLRLACRRTDRARRGLGGQEGGLGEEGEDGSDQDESVAADKTGADLTAAVQGFAEIGTDLRKLSEARCERALQCLARSLLQVMSVVRV